MGAWLGKTVLAVQSILTNTTCPAAVPPVTAAIEMQVLVDTSSFLAHPSAKVKSGVVPSMTPEVTSVPQTLYTISCYTRAISTSTHSLIYGTNVQ